MKRAAVRRQCGANVQPLDLPDLSGVTENQIVAACGSPPATDRRAVSRRSSRITCNPASHLCGASGVERMNVSMAVSGDTPLRVRKRLGLA